MIDVVHHTSIPERQFGTYDISWTVLEKERSDIGVESHQVSVLSLLGSIDWEPPDHYAMRAHQHGRKIGHFFLLEARILWHENAIFRWGRHLESWIQPIEGVVSLGKEVIRI